MWGVNYPLSLPPSPSYLYQEQPIMKELSTSVKARHDAVVAKYGACSNFLKEKFGRTLTVMVSLRSFFFFAMEVEKKEFTIDLLIDKEVLSDYVT